MYTGLHIGLVWTISALNTQQFLQIVLLYGSKVQGYHILIWLSHLALENVVSSSEFSG